MSYRRGYKKYRRSNKRKRGLSTSTVKRIATMQHRFSLPSVDRQYDTGRLDTAMNQCAYLELPMFTAAEMEALLAGAGPYYLQWNSAHTAHTYQAAPNDYDATDRVYADTSLVWTKRANQRINIRNNDLIEIEMQIYEYLCVDDTSIDVMSEMDRHYHIRRNTSANLDTNLLVNISEYNSKLDHWKFVRMDKMRLSPGDEKVIYVKPGKGWYHSKDENVAAGSYVKNITKAFIIRIVGTLGHDTTSKSLVGRLKCGIDYEITRFLEFKSYDGVSKKHETVHQ